MGKHEDLWSRALEVLRMAGDTTFGDGSGRSGETAQSDPMAHVYDVGHEARSRLPQSADEAWAVAYGRDPQFPTADAGVLDQRAPSSLASYARVMPDGTLEMLGQLPEIALEDLALTAGLDVDAFMERIERGLHSGMTPEAEVAERVCMGLWAISVTVDEAIGEAIAVFEAGVTEGVAWFWRLTR